MRRRKETLLEKNLVLKGYMLTEKTYCGSKSEKIKFYVYKKNNGVIHYEVELDPKREQILYYCFTNSTNMVYSDGTLESLQMINDNFHKELMEIYDFENKVAKEYTPIEDLDDIEQVFVEEALFDD